MALWPPFTSFCITHSAVLMTMNVHSTPSMMRGDNNRDKDEGENKMHWKGAWEDVMVGTHHEWGRDCLHSVHYRFNTGITGDNVRGPGPEPDKWQTFSRFNMRGNQNPLIAQENTIPARKRIQNKGRWGTPPTRYLWTHDPFPHSSFSSSSLNYLWRLLSLALRMFVSCFSL